MKTIIPPSQRLQQIFMLSPLFGLLGILVVFGFPSVARSAEKLPVVEASMTYAPNVPPPITRKSPARVVVTLEAKEYLDEIAPGVKTEVWGYNGHVPGPFIRVREGDSLEVHFKNAPKNETSHTVDFHAVTGPCGAACWLLTEPGKESAVLARTMNPGLYIYHCAAQPIPVHIAKGLYGLILVEPKEGMSKVDREYYILQSEFYTEGVPDKDGIVAFSSKNGMDEHPSYVVFNGKVGALTEGNALKAKTGETIRFYVGNIGPHLISSFHLIGEIFDRVWREGSLSNEERNIQTTLIPAGGASTVEFKVDVPGNFTIVDHSIFRINKGAVGTLHVDGPPNPDVYQKLEIKEPAQKNK